MSGGEKQRISIARAMLKDAPIIILDEATSSVDPENEDELQRAIEALTHDKTIIMIAHRLKTVRNADQILVLQKKLGMVRSVDVARHMEVTKPSVCHAVATLRDGGFLMMDEDHFLHLTDVGREVAEKIYERHCFFTEQLITAGVDPKTAEADACRIEHIISDESFDRLKEAAEQEQD